MSSNGEKVLDLLGIRPGDPVIPGWHLEGVQDLGRGGIVSCLIRDSRDSGSLVEIRIQPRTDPAAHYVLTRRFAVAYRSQEGDAARGEVLGVVDRMVELLRRGEEEKQVHGVGAEFFIELPDEPTLFLLPGHIGHPMDIGGRTLHILMHTRHVFVEEGLQDEAREFLRSVNITDATKAFVEIAKDGARNEEALRALRDVHRQGLHACLFGVGEGTPCFLDPGTDLIGEAQRLGMRVLSTGGPSSLSNAVMRLGGPVDEFTVLGRLEHQGDLERIERRLIAMGRLPVAIFTEGHTCPTLLAEILERYRWERAILLMELTTDREESVHLDLSGDLREQLSRIPAAARIVAWLVPDRGFVARTLRRIRKVRGMAERIAGPGTRRR